MRKSSEYTGEDGSTYLLTEEEGYRTFHARVNPWKPWLYATPALADLEKYKKALEEVSEEIIEISEYARIKNSIAELCIDGCWISTTPFFQEVITQAYEAGKRDAVK